MSLRQKVRPKASSKSRYAKQPGLCDGSRLPVVTSFFAERKNASFPASMSAAPR